MGGSFPHGDGSARWAATPTSRSALRFSFGAATTGFGFPTQPNLAVIQFGVNDCAGLYGVGGRGRGKGWGINRPGPATIPAAGGPPREAVAGWERARRTVLVADAVSFLAALVLWLVSIGSVKGFAFTLGLTTLIDVVVVFLFTKPMISWLARTRFFGQGHPMSGLDPRRLGAKQQRAPRRTAGSTGSTATKEA